MPKKGYKQSKEHKDKISEALKGRCLSDKTKRKISRNSSKYWLGKHFSKLHRQKISEAKEGNYHSEKTIRKMRRKKKGKNNPMFGKQQTDEAKIKQSKSNSSPKAVQRALKNGFGNNCYYGNKFFPSLSERDCYIELKKLGFKIKHNFEGRFDFLVNDKVVIEFHSYDRNGLTNKQYYVQRRKLLNEYGYKDLKLVVIKDLKEIENKLIN